VLQTLGRLIGRNTKLNVASRFEINKVPSKGSTALVHRAVDKKSGETFALKLIDPNKTKSFRHRFGKLSFPSEGEIQQSLELPHVVKAYEAGITTQGKDYILLEYVKAPTLEDVFRGYTDKKIPEPLSLISQLSRTIHAIHQAGYIHRDICPRNIFITDDLSSCKLFDFGLTVPNKPEFNQPGNRTGCPLHMAPEIARRRLTDHRIDIFSFGVVAYRLLTGHHPWGTTEINSKSALVHDSRPPIDIREYRPNLNANLASAINRCLAAKPDQRFADMKRFLIQAGGAKREVA
jgi:serine/threonine-protein kinase